MFILNFINLNFVCAQLFFGVKELKGVKELRRMSFPFKVPFEETSYGVLAAGKRQSRAKTNVFSL